MLTISICYVIAEKRLLLTLNPLINCRHKLALGLNCFKDITENEENRDELFASIYELCSAVYWFLPFLFRFLMETIQQIRPLD